MSVESKKENPGWYWDHVNKRFYRWHELLLLMRERKVKEKQDDTR